MDVLSPQGSAEINGVKIGNLVNISSDTAKNGQRASWIIGRPFRRTSSRRLEEP